MKKKQILTLVLLVAVLALLCGAYVLVTKLDDGTDNVTTNPDPTVTILTVDIESLHEIGYRVGDEQLRFTLDGGVWRWVDNPALNLDSAKFASMVEGILTLTSNVTISSPDEAMLAEFGLHTPANTIVLTDAAGTHTIYVGGYNSYNSSYYVGIDSTETVHMAAAAAMEAFSMRVTDLLAYDALPTITAGKISSVTMTRVAPEGEKTLRYTYYGSGNPDAYTDTFLWYVAVQGGAARAVATATGNSLSSAITGLSFAECVSYHREVDAAQFGLDAPARLEIAYRRPVETTDASTGASTTTDVDASYTLLLGDLDAETGCYYAAVEGSPLIYRLSNAELSELLEPEDAIALPLQIAPFNYDYVDKITFEAGVKRFTVQIAHGAETAYTIGGDAVPFSSLSALFSAAQSMSAEASVQSVAPDAAESTTPDVRITVTFNRGTVSEAVLTITPYNTNFDRVSFLDRDDQLISIRTTENLVNLITQYGAQVEQSK